MKRALEEKLRSQYRIIRMLGRGGMGAVYLARDLTLDREVAIKVVNTAGESRELYERFRREAKTVAKLSHPNIVPLHAFGEVDAMPYFVMGYVRGESLADRLRREGRLEEDEARRIIGEVAQALDHAHRLGVIHRDVKPDNVLLDDETGRALLTDFGVAKAAETGETLTSFGAIIGTPHFMSPEQASGHGPTDARSDIYSLGVMAYAMIAGRLPFEGSSAADVLTKHLTQEPPSLRSVALAVSDTTAQVVERCLAKDPAQRWQDARSLAQTLGATHVEHLPDSLQAVEGRGIPAFVFGLLLILVYFSLPYGEGPVIAVAGMWVVLYAFTTVSLLREGFSFMQSQTVIWREPAWWLFWYPPALRRRGNVWSRLPQAVRQFRMWNTVLALLACAAPVILVLGGVRRLAYDPANLIMVVLGAMIVLWLVLRSRASAELKGQAVDSHDISRILLSAPRRRHRGVYRRGRADRVRNGDRRAAFNQAATDLTQFLNVS
ncbi:MAG TPA: serine/threonine-protein kinase [Thermoanaerobaculia bacterium]|nr:serine/threonine-protein kinase [Thermoanaerobaculia bacterium]